MNFCFLLILCVVAKPLNTFLKSRSKLQNTLFIEVRLRAVDCTSASLAKRLPSKKFYMGANN